MKNITQCMIKLSQTVSADLFMKQNVPCVLQIFIRFCDHSKNFAGVKLSLDGFVKNRRESKIGELIILGQFPRRFLINSSSFSQNSCCDTSKWIPESIAMSRCLGVS